MATVVRLALIVIQVMAFRQAIMVISSASGAVMNFADMAMVVFISE